MTFISRIKDVSTVSKKVLGLIKRTRNEFTPPKIIIKQGPFNLSKDEFHLYQPSNMLKTHKHENLELVKKNGIDLYTKTVRTTEVALDGCKKYLKEVFQGPTPDEGALVYSQTSSYNKNRQLLNKALEVAGEDRTGPYKVNVTTTFEHSGAKPTIASVQKQKTYLNTISDENPSGIYSRRSIIFDSEGKRLVEKFENDKQWIINEFSTDDKPILVNSSKK